MSADNVSVAGPYSLAERPGRLGYVLQRDAPQPARACIILDQRTQVLSETVTGALADIAEALWSAVWREYETLPAGWVVVLHLAPGTKEGQVSGPTFVRTKQPADAQALAELQLAATVDVLVVGDDVFLTSQDPQRPGDTGPQTLHVLGPSSYHQVTAFSEGEDLSAALRAALSLPAAERARGEATLWFGDLRQALANQDAPMALHAFVSFVKYWRQSDRAQSGELTEQQTPFELTPPQVIEIGMRVYDLLRSLGHVDYAELVAELMGAVAEDAADRNGAVKAWRMAGIVAEASGNLDAVSRHYTRALACLDEKTPAIERARTLMSFGISIGSCLEDLHFSALPAAERQRRMVLASDAEAHLRAARAIYSGLEAEDAAWPLLSIDLELVRILDIHGRHDDALSALQALSIPQTDQRLRSSAALYELAARWNIVESTPDDEAGSKAVQAFMEAMRRVRELFASIPQVTERYAYYALFRARVAATMEDHAAAAGMLDNALSMQERRAAGLIRPPAPGALRGGLLAIDIAGLLQQALIKASCKEGLADDEAVRFGSDALMVADRSKSRWFVRDLLFMSVGQADEPPLLQEEKRRLRDMVLDGELDHRVVLSKFDWFQRHYASEGEGATAEDLRVLGAATYERGLEALLSESAAPLFVSFYATDEHTFVYCLNNVAGPHIAYAMRISREELEAAASDLSIGILGDGQTPAVDPANPGANAQCFKRLEQIAGQLQALVVHLRDADLIVLSLHAAWHDLPIEALLFEALWAEGVRPAIVTVASLGAVGALARREERGSGLHKGGIGLLTAWSAGDRPKLFVDAHEKLLGTLQESGRRVTAEQGSLATGAALLGWANSVGYLHVLAHGVAEPGSNAMQARLLLSSEGKPRSFEDPPDPTCTAAALMAQGTTAHHITLQACSLGRSQRATGDELWGYGRAALAAGARTVLAPLWSISLNSSTALLDAFYRYWLIQRLPIGRALANAMFDMRHEPQRKGWSHFYHWGALRLTGLRGR